MFSCVSFTLDRALSRFADGVTQYFGRRVQRLRLPLGDVTAMHIELLSQLRRRLVIPQRRDRPFALNDALWFLLGLLITAPLSGGVFARQSWFFTSASPKSPGPLLTSGPVTRC